MKIEVTDKATTATNAAAAASNQTRSKSAPLNKTLKLQLSSKILFPAYHIYYREKNDSSIYECFILMANATWRYIYQYVS